MARDGIVSRLISTAIAHNAVAEANGWQDNETTDQLAREHNATRRRATADEITAFEQHFAKNNKN